MNLLGRVGGLSLIPVLAAALPVSALDYPLTPTSIRSAFLTGSNGNDRASNLFAGYTHEFDAAQNGAYIESISVATPYEQVAEIGALKNVDYHAQEAEQEFSGKEMPFLVRVHIRFRQDYSAAPRRGTQTGMSTLQPIPNYERDFKIRATQNEQLAPLAQRAYLTLSFAAHDVNGVEGIVIEQEYDASRLEASDLRVEVTAPGDQDIQTTFDLGRLH